MRSPLASETRSLLSIFKLLSCVYACFPQREAVNYRSEYVSFKCYAQHFLQRLETLHSSSRRFPISFVRFYYFSTLRDVMPLTKMDQKDFRDELDPAEGARKNDVVGINDNQSAKSRRTASRRRSKLDQGSRGKTKEKDMQPCLEASPVRDEFLDI